MQTKSPRMTRDQLINHCYEVLRRKGRGANKFVSCGVNDSLKADLVTATTVYEFREVLSREKLYEAKGQGLTYASFLKKNRVVLVGYLPDGDYGSAANAAENIERAGQQVKVSFVDVDPFWEIATPDNRWMRTAFLTVGVVALIVFLIPLISNRSYCRLNPTLPRCSPTIQRH
ncbi:hypothetical protein [Egbenema bharatensis]|uniref:hypothetical protein n=1 Tax=Egbenema bharatensis TaxID=3463334 RepID=UPI003A86C6F7